MNTYRLEQEAQAAAALLEVYKSSLADDDTARADFIEGETGLRELLARTTRELLAVEGMKDGLGHAIARMTDRRRRLADKADKIRDAIKSALEAVGEKKMALACATLSITAKPPAVIVFNEALIPESYLKTRVELDKITMRDAMKAGEIIPGAGLTNGGSTLVVRSS